MPACVNRGCRLKKKWLKSLEQPQDTVERYRCRLFWQSWGQRSEFPSVTFPPSVPFPGPIPKVSTRPRV